MTVRRLGPADPSTFQALRLEMLRETPGAYASFEQDWTSLSEAEWRARMDAMVAVAAFDGAEAVGFMGILPMLSRKMSHRGSLVMVYMRATHRGRGLSNLLLEATLDEAPSLGIEQVELAVRADNTRAIEFYAKHGFRRIGIVPCGLRDTDQCFDELLMVRRLSA